MLCFLCSFAKGGYCYCRPGRPVTVLSTLDMLIVDTSFPTAQAPRRRSRSEPVRRKECSQFVRFRSLREAKVERRDRKKPLRIDVVSIASSAESKLRRRKTRRERTRRRMEVQSDHFDRLLSTSSSSLQSMASDALQPLMANRSTSSPASEASSEGLSSAELAQAIEIPSRSSFALLVNGNNHMESKDAPPLDRGDFVNTQKKICPTIIDRLHLDLVQLSDAAAPNGWLGSVSYVTDMEQFVQKLPVNAFVDPFEEEERRSRTEMWVESTSPGYPSEEENGGEVAANAGGSENSMEIPEVKVSECSEKSVSASPPGNTTTSTTGADEEPLPPSVQIHINGELLPTAKIQKNVMDRLDSLVTSEVSEANSLVSSEVDKISLVKCQFTSNIHHALDDAKKEIDFDQIDRFWRYRYNKTEPESEEEKKEKIEKDVREMNRHRAHTPTIERVVLYYTTDRRLSSTPTVSSMSPSPEPFSQRSPLPESGKNLFIQCVRPAVSQHDSLTSEPIGDVVVPVMTPVFEEEEKGIEHVRVENPQRHFERAIVGGESNSSELKRNDVVSEQKEELKESSDEISTELLIPNKPIDVESHKESTPFFRLDRISSGEESEDGRVIFVESRDLPAAFLKRHHRLKDESTSTADLEDFMTDVIRDGWSDNNANYKKEVHDKSTVTSPSLNSNSSQQQFFEKHMMQDQATSMSLSPASSPLPPLVVLEDAPETDVSLPDLKDHFSDLESSSVEDLLAIETRPSSVNRKSVTFSDLIDVEPSSPESIRKERSQSPFGHNFDLKPILKKEDKQKETMRRLLEYASERLYKDLLMLVEERDRSIHALEITPDDAKDLSEQTTFFQKKYRDKLLENKFALDKRIDQVWLKLRDMPIDAHKAHLIYGVRHSSELTLNVKRRLAVRRSSCQIEKKEKRNEMELASDFSRRLSRVREQMIRRDSDSLLATEDNRSMEDLLNAVSRIFGSYEKLCST